MLHLVLYCDVCIQATSWLLVPSSHQYLFIVYADPLLLTDGPSSWVGALLTRFEVSKGGRVFSVVVATVTGGGASAIAGIS